MEEIHIKNESELQRKIEKIKQDGLQKLHVVSDFDRTLTNCFFSGKKIPSTIALIRAGGYLTEDYPKKAFALFDKYNPIELNETLNPDYRYKMMKDWWETHEKLLVESGMHKRIIDDILLKYPKILRDKTDEFLDFLHQNNVPLLIFSAGLGNVIEGHLQKEKKLTNNVYVLSNTFDFDENGYAKGYKEEVIHLLNKSEKKITNKKYKDVIAQRKNIILLGDSLEDIGMANNLDTNTVISVGFLNEKINERLETYKKNFDVVITNDGSMSYVNKLLKELVNY